MNLVAVSIASLVFASLQAQPQSFDTADVVRKARPGIVLIRGMTALTTFVLSHSLY